MLYIYLNEPDNCLMDVDYWFNRNKKAAWFNRQDVKDVILGIDNTVAVKDEYMESPVFGGMSPDRLSTGCKAVICMMVQERPVYATVCGDNCSKWIVMASLSKDVYIHLMHCLRFPDVFEAQFVESGVVVHSRKEFVDEYYKFRHQG